MGVWISHFRKQLFHLIKGTYFRLFHHKITNLSHFSVLEFLNAFLFLREESWAFISLVTLQNCTSRFLIMQFILSQWILEVSHQRTPAMLRPTSHWFNLRPVVLQSWQDSFSFRSWVISTILCISYLSLSWINIFLLHGKAAWSRCSSPQRWQWVGILSHPTDKSVHVLPSNETVGPHKDLWCLWFSTFHPFHWMKALPREGPWPWWSAPPSLPVAESCSLQVRTFHCQCFRDWGMHPSGMLGWPGGLWRCVGAMYWQASKRRGQEESACWVQEPNAAGHDGPTLGPQPSLPFCLTVMLKVTGLRFPQAQRFLLHPQHSSRNLKGWLPTLFHDCFPTGFSLGANAEAVRVNTERPQGACPAEARATPPEWTEQRSERAGPSSGVPDNQQRPSRGSLLWPGASHLPAVFRDFGSALMKLLLPKPRMLLPVLRLLFCSWYLRVVLVERAVKPFLCLLFWARSIPGTSCQMTLGWATRNCIFMEFKNAPVLAISRGSISQTLSPPGLK